MLLSLSWVICSVLISFILLTLHVFVLIIAIDLQELQVLWLRSEVGQVTGPSGSASKLYFVMSIISYIGSVKVFFFYKKNSTDI